MAVFLFFWISPAVNSTKSFKNLAEKGYCWFLQSCAMLFMQLKGEVEAEHSKLIMGRQSKTRAYQFGRFQMYAMLLCRAWEN
jgi:hypothetical protein